LFKSASRLPLVFEHCACNQQAVPFLPHTHKPFHPPAAHEALLLSGHQSRGGAREALTRSGLAAKALRWGRGGGWAQVKKGGRCVGGKRRVRERGARSSRSSGRGQDAWPLLSLGKWPCGASGAVKRPREVNGGWTSARRPPPYFPLISSPPLREEPLEATFRWLCVMGRGSVKCLPHPRTHRTRGDLSLVVREGHVWGLG
jgi:hypothetical protein